MTKWNIDVSLYTKEAIEKLIDFVYDYDTSISESLNCDFDNLYSND